MKQKLLHVSFAVIFLLTACAVPVATVTPAKTASLTETSSPFPTSTSLPTDTPTPSITPLPTISTFTPTFDVSTIVTVTPEPKAKCLITGNPRPIAFATFPSGQKYVGHSTVDEIMMFLNLGGTLEHLNYELKQITSAFLIEDVTNDGTPDLVIVSGSFFQTVNILWCENGKYNLFPKDGAEAETLGSEQVKFSMQDLNQNGLQDILSIGDGRGLNVNILEWDGKKFHDLTADETGINAFVTYAARDDYELKDLNNDGIPEIILKGLPPRSQDEPGDPLRSYTYTYYWNGTDYSSRKDFRSPQYRFQAIQDADTQALRGNYLQAEKLYQDAIVSEKLDWWSKERYEQNRTAAISSSTPSALAPDLTEYPHHAAYAYYRIMLLHLVQGNEQEADLAYETLQQKFDIDQYGHPYVEMATAFWNAYQSTQKMYDGCAAAIQYAAEHPGILIPLGSDYHGLQSNTYVPADVCPFR